MSDNNIMSAMRQIAAERKIDVEEILDAIKDAIKVGFKKEYEFENLETDPLSVEFDPEKGHIAVYVEKEVVKKVENEKLEISEKEAKEISKDLKIGDKVLIDITPEGDFGRIAAQTARQVILQKLRESEKEAAINEIKDKIGTIETVTVQHITREGDVICEINRARAVMPKNERVHSEYYQLGSRLKVLLKSLEEDTRGKYILISRADNNFLAELFRMEVPEIDSGSVEIVAIARDPGSRSKVAVKSNSEGIDPIGSCVGQKGIRINSIMNELKLGNQEEKVDIILWEEDPKTFIMNAIQPAEAEAVKLIEKSKKAIVYVREDQHSLAIGREGQNARLASRLTGWEIDIEENVKDGGKEKKIKAPKEEDEGASSVIIDEASESAKEEKVEEETKENDSAN